MLEWERCLCLLADCPFCWGMNCLPGTHCVCPRGVGRPVLPGDLVQNRRSPETAWYHSVCLWCGFNFFSCYCDLLKSLKKSENGLQSMGPENGVS